MRLKAYAGIAALALCYLSVQVAFAQGPADFFNVFSRVMNAAMIDAARKEWRTRPIEEINCLASHGVSVDNLAAQGVTPSDPRVQNLLAQCRAVSFPSHAVDNQQNVARTAEASKAYNPKFVIDGIALGSIVRPEAGPDHSYKCEPSDQFPGFLWCRRTRTEQGRFGPYTSWLSILHSEEGRVVYVSKSISPAFFARGDAEREINRLSRDFGLSANILRSQSTSANGESGVLASWGNIKLTALDDQAMDDLRRGRPISKGLLFDFLDNARRSARA